MTLGMLASAGLLFLGLVGTCSIVAAPLGMPAIMLGAVGLVAFAIARGAFR